MARQPVKHEEGKAEEAVVSSVMAPSVAVPATAAPAKRKRAYAGKVRALTNLDHPYGTARQPGEVFEMDEESVRHFLLHGGVELVDDE